MWGAVRERPQRPRTRGCPGRPGTGTAAVCPCVRNKSRLSTQTVLLYEDVLGNNVPIGSGDINNVCGEAHKCKLEFSSVVFVLNHLDETILKALSFPWHLE